MPKIKKRSSSRKKLSHRTPNPIIAEARHLVEAHCATSRTVLANHRKARRPIRAAGARTVTEARDLARIAADKRRARLFPAEPAHREAA